MGIKKVLEDGKFKYEVFVKVRDKSGKQVMRRLILPRKTGHGVMRI